MQHRNESCDRANGYRDGGCENDDDPEANARCRLCGTCMEGFKRTGGRTQCKACPASTTNKALLGLGFVLLLVGSMVLIFVTIQAEGGADATSESIKKIILNFLQVVSLAANLPLQWPPAVAEFLSGLNVLASAGSTLLIPDCELTTMRTSEAFYMKQIGFTSIVPLVVLTCVVGWNIIFKLCRRKAKLSHAKKIDYTILSIVLLLFIAYPMLVQLCLSMLKCPKVGQAAADRFLMADLQSRCFSGRHLLFFLALTVPQIILYVIGLPVFAVILMWREPKRRVAFSYHFRIRYGLLFMGCKWSMFWFACAFFRDSDAHSFDICIICLSALFS
jgi:hypothetical protein